MWTTAVPPLDRRGCCHLEAGVNPCPRRAVARGTLGTLLGLDRGRWVELEGCMNTLFHSKPLPLNSENPPVRALARPMARGPE